MPFVRPPGPRHPHSLEKTPMDHDPVPESPVYMWPKEGGRPFRWCTCVSAWGDTLTSCGRILEALRRTNQKRTGIVYYGPHGQVRDFLEQQPWCREALWVPPSDHRTMMDLYAADRRVPGWWVDEFLREGLVPREEVCWTHTRGNLLDDLEERFIWHGASLPGRDRTWAENWIKSKGLGDCGFLLVHPWSFQSCALYHHWKYWERAIQWILSNTSWNVVLTGQFFPKDLQIHRDQSLLSNQRFHVLVNRSGHMHQVLALAERSRGVVSGPHAVSIWSVVQKIPNLTVGNVALDNHNNFFWRWIEEGQRGNGNGIGTGKWVLMDWKVGWEEWLVNFQRWITGLENYVPFATAGEIRLKPSLRTAKTTKFVSVNSGIES